MKKVLSLVLALLMTASTASAVLADDVVAIAEEPVAVEEVAEEVEAGQYDKAIEFLANYGIFKGYNADDTGAEDLIQRYQMALFVGRIATGWVDDEQWEDGPENWSEFNDIDVDPVNKYYGALSFANQKGIIEGYGNGKFGPTDSIKYQDALTMVVRTLGYTGLDWPWGYIQKAVELGLTDGITGVAYTDELTRGEVAQIIYNALFAKMKDGSNLALKNFGIEFGWEKVVITASNINTFEKLANDKGTKVEKELVEFKLLNDDGTLADDSYKALAADFNLDYTKHEDDLAVGNAYYVLFEKDADSALAEIVAVESLLVDVIENEGKTDDDADEQDYAIQAFLENYTLVDKYSANNYLNITSSLKPELLVWDVNGGITVEEVDGHYIAINWVDGHIMAPAYKDGKPVDANEDEKIDENDYVVRWFYNPTLERYYEKQYDKDGTLLGINYMTDDEFEDFYASLVKKSEHKYKGFTAITSIEKTAYATLEVFDTNLDRVADRALYETYKLGYFANSTEKCGDCGKEYATWTFSEVGTEEKSVGAGAPSTELWIEATCDHKSHAWFVEGYTPVVAYDEDGEEDGYENGYVIYSYDAETGAIKVVKNINDGSDEDSYVATGVVRAYNVKNETITIGEKDLTMNYDELAGTGFYKVNDSAARKVMYSAILNKYFNQFVKYVVVDGELVHIELAGAKSTDELIVVDSYAGLSSDGYIVINGYSTDDLEYARFRLGSIDGWKSGDAYYNVDEYADGFGKGDVYKVVSYDEEEDVYFVELITETVDNGNTYITNYVDDYESEYVHLYTDGSEDSYMTKESKFDYKEGEFTKEEYVKMSSSDKYIFVIRNTNNPYAVINVYEGKLPANADIWGDVVKAKDGTYVFVNAHTRNLAMDAYEAGIVVLCEDSRFEKASYNGEGAEDWYLLGAVEYEVRAFNLLTGGDVDVYATNKNYDLGYAYYTQDGVLAEKEDQPAKVNYSFELVSFVNNTFTADSYVADTLNVLDAEGNFTVIGQDKDGEDVTFDALYNTKDGANKKAVEAMILSAGLEIDGSSKYLNKIDGVTYRVITFDETTGRYTSDTKIAKIDDSVKGDDKDAKAFKKFVEDGKYTTLTAFYVYDVEGRDVVIYLVLNEENGETVVDKTSSDTGTITAECVTGIDDVKDNEDAIVLKDVATDVQIVASEVSYAANYDDGEIVEAAITGVKFGFTGKYFEDLLANDSLPVADDVHATPAFQYHYGVKAADDAALAARYTFGTCKDGANTYVLVYGVENQPIEVAVKSVKEVTYDNVCNLVQGFEIEFADKAYIPEGTANCVVELHITEANGAERVYSFEVEVIDEVTLHGDDYENVVLVNAH